MNKIFAVAGVVIKELYRRKDFYVLFILVVLITGVMWCMKFFHDESIIRFIKEVCLMLIAISALVIAVTTAARQMPAERESRTIFPLLAKPISRWQVLAGKFLGCWTATGIALFVFYSFFAVVAASREHTLPLGACFEAFWLHWQMLGIVIAMTLLGSVIFSLAANITIVFVLTIGILFVGGYLHLLSSRMVEPTATITTVIYFLIPHLELFSMRDLITHDWPQDPGMWRYVLQATVYALAYMCVFLLAGCLVFRRKALN